MINADDQGSTAEIRIRLFCIDNFETYILNFYVSCHIDEFFEKFGGNVL